MKNYHRKMALLAVILPLTQLLSFENSNIDLIYMERKNYNIETRQDGTKGWDDAVIYCNSLNTGGISGWHLPNVSEAYSARIYGWTSTTVSHDTTQAYNISDLTIYDFNIINDYPEISFFPKTQETSFSCVRYID